MIIKARTAAIFLVAFILLSIIVLRIGGLWKTESSKVPTLISSGDFEGEANPADIKGSYAFSDIEEHFGIPSLTLARAFNFDVSEDEAGTITAKTVEENFEGAAGLEGDIGTDAVRTFVALYNGVPHEGEEDTVLPSTAVDILLAEGKVSEAVAEDLYASGYRIEGGSVAPAPAPAAEAEDHAEEAVDTTIKGKTTFNDLLDWGLTETQIEEVLGVQMGKGTMAVRDFAEDAGEEFSVYKSELQALLDEL